MKKKKLSHSSNHSPQMAKEKKQSIVQEEEEDRLSHLPNELLIRILSELSTKDSIRTSVLSKRWKHLWSQVPVLAVDANDFPDRDDEAFVVFVDDFMETNKELELKKFDMVYDVYVHDESVLDSWINTAIRRKVCDLRIRNEVDETNIDVVVMPLSLYSCETLVNLTLNHLVLDEHDSDSPISLPCLKTMFLDRIKYCGDDKLLENLISSSESLQELTIIREDDDYLESVMVRSKSLKSLTLECLRFERLGRLPTLTIDTPKLEFMDLTDHFSEHFTIESIGPSADVHIDVIFDIEYGKLLNPKDSSKIVMIGNFLTGLSTVSHLTISAATLEVIRDYSYIEPLPRFVNIRYLDVSFLESSLKTLLYVLESCPNLHTLTLEFHPQPSVDPIRLSSVPECFLSSLMFVHLKTRVAATESLSRMKLAVYFMRNCVVLRELVLSESFGDIMKKIKGIPKRSRKCKIVMDSSQPTKSLLYQNPVSC